VSGVSLCVISYINKLILSPINNDPDYINEVSSSFDGKIERYLCVDSRGCKDKKGIHILQWCFKLCLVESGLLLNDKHYCKYIRI
jgi:hypothetical protein